MTTKINTMKFLLSLLVVFPFRRWPNLGRLGVAVAAAAAAAAAELPERQRQYTQ